MLSEMLFKADELSKYWNQYKDHRTRHPENTKAQLAVSQMRFCIFRTSSSSGR